VTLAEAPAISIGAGEVTIFEGAQGVLLDRDHGFFPHVTPSRTTFANADALLAEASRVDSIARIGVLRAYATRHGEGPFVSEDAALTAATPDLHNGADGFQGAFRVGWLDVVAARYALRVVGGVDWLAITNLDRLAGLSRVRVCTAYTIEGERDILHDLPRESDAAAVSPEARAALTARISRCRPVYTELPGWRGADDPPPTRSCAFWSRPRRWTRPWAWPRGGRDPVTRSSPTLHRGALDWLPRRAAPAGARRDSIAKSRNVVTFRGACFAAVETIDRSPLRIVQRGSTRTRAPVVTSASARNVGKRPSPAPTPIAARTFPRGAPRGAGGSVMR
jgi:hypothetical protein